MKNPFKFIKEKIVERFDKKRDEKIKRNELITNYNKVMKEDSERKESIDYSIKPDSYISLQHVNKIYESNDVQAVFDFNLDIKKGEFIVFVGPSGCGKSTALRMIAGLESITAGDLWIDGTYSNDLEPKDRDTAMVFQNYALYPHLSVYENLAMGLKVKKVPKDEIDRRIKRASEILQLQDYLDRKPRNLSGGQCQRVALGRAIVKEAKVFLMDEPLSNLDAKLRVQMRSEIISLHKELGATTIYVTHDQIEAMTMADRIVVMEKGHIKQIGTPSEVYSRPNDLFVATFIGAPSMNILHCDVKGDDISYCGEVLFKQHIDKEKVIVGFRPEDIVTSPVEDSFKIDCTISLNEMSGKENVIHAKYNDSTIQFIKKGNDRLDIGETISLYIPISKLHLFDIDSKKRIN